MIEFLVPLPDVPTLAEQKSRLLTDLAAAGISDRRVFAAVDWVPRERFVPPTFLNRAYENVALPIGSGQTVSQPLIVALMSQALELEDRHKVLEIGTGSGYQTAILSRLARRVFSIERHRDLLAEADRRLKDLRLRNVTLRYGDGIKGWPEAAPFDRVMVTAAAPTVPALLADMLAEGGVLVAPVGEERRDQQLVRVRRGPFGFDTEILGAVRFVPLVSGLPRGFARTARQPAGDGLHLGQEARTSHELDPAGRARGTMSVQVE